MASNGFHSNVVAGSMEFLQWDCEDVARWIESLGFPQYKACFTKNYITGRKLIYVNCVYLPRLGITDFKDMQVISAHVRELLGITESPWNQCIADPRRDRMGLFLERKSRTGEEADALELHDVSQAEGATASSSTLSVEEESVEEEEQSARHVSVASRQQLSAPNDSDETLAAGHTEAQHEHVPPATTVCCD